ncbi:YTH domain-containing protein 1-like isoform X1 [Stegodyphus dumicola]|uniref:YTH domain-containing protein 1-like isoform X1 n=1 Tax=Stegodyphus dumicola TaxID=202533 RepID=UPI0015AEF897|nr:YTH domain-containing protein 1-like isoform X1 [Stegodyphus dumicola]
MDAKADVEVNLLDELLDPGVDDELIAELDSQEKKIAAKPQVSPQAKVPVKTSEKSTTKVKKVVKAQAKGAKPSVSGEKKATVKSNANGSSMRQVVIKPSQKNETSNVPSSKAPVRIVKKIVPKTVKASNSTSKQSTNSVPTKIIQKTIIVKKDAPASTAKVESAPKRSIPAGIISAPSTVRKSVKVVQKKPAPAPQNPQPVVKCVLRGTDQQSKALANKSFSHSNSSSREKSHPEVMKKHEKHESVESKINLSAASDDDLPDEKDKSEIKDSKNACFSTVSDASSSIADDVTCSCGRSSVMSSSPSMSRSASPSASPSNSDSESDEESPGKRSRKRTHSPVVYERKGSKERSEKKPRVSSSVSKRDYSHLLKYFFRDARFFLVKSNNHENVALSKAKGVWSTPPQNESKLNQAYRTCRNVILVFSVKESGKFQGFARMSSESRHDVPTIQWVLPPGLSARALGGVFRLDYICRRELSFTKTQHLYNPWNEGKQVKIGRDGQEIEPKVGEELCRLFPVDENIDLISVLRNMKRSKPRTSRSREERERQDRRRAVHSSSRRSPPDSLRRRRKRPESFDSSRPKRSRQDYHEGYYKPMSGRERSPMDRYSMRNRSSVVNGNYGEYIRDYHHQRAPMPPMPFGPPCNFPQPPFGMEPSPYYERSVHHQEFSASRPRPLDKRAYERSVDDFLRRTARMPNRMDRRYRERR